ncbi:hypothetical protein Poli38472_005995 [Pythium oligandrum]|uniref:Uncharacterized protein n=1 Tax=Pythium oligandrum TaxID=41045 RepID=A0A8K1CRK3_PYTOL|nr:hypothetical protein Poli38472_005995 [Pythium oligandrum]|eukprot:TMW68527.1 hypothetical protein Poli38472_005995 [Pythium oligandrum]
MAHAVMAPPVATDASFAEDDDDGVTDSRRNWGPEVTLKLVKIWKRVSEEHPDIGRLERMEMIYDEFQQSLDCANRSRKAVEDKLYTIKQMYHFIIKMNGNFKQGYRKSMPTWFELTKDERRAVRSLHRIRIPNISLEVFNVVDSVLNPYPQLLQPNENISTHMEVNQIISNLRQEEKNGDPQETSPVVSISETENGSSKDSENVEVLDNRRNWSYEVTIQLAKAWHTAVRSNRELRGAMLSQRVYNEFMSLVGGCSRSRKAIEDKMHSMKEMYRFIRTYNAECLPGSQKRPWFELTKGEKRHLRTTHNIRVPNLSVDVFNELDAFMNFGSDLLDASSTALLQVAQHYQSDHTSFASSGLTIDSTNKQQMAEMLMNRRLPGRTISDHIDTEPTRASQIRRLDPNEAGESPPSKRCRVDQEAGTIELLLQQLVALQQQAIVERRQQHQEQMHLLQAIVQRLPNPPGL